MRRRMAITAGRLSLASAHRLGIVAVLFTYAWLAGQYARLTPPWQAPDEPAHFNYIARVAASPLDPPVIEPGDYPFAYLEELKARRFPKEWSITGITYEDHQPPLYYYLAAVAYRLAPPHTAARLLAVRLVSVALGGVVVFGAWWFARRGWPGNAWLPLATAGFVGFLPMHLAVSAAANNDALANAVAVLALAWSFERAMWRPKGERPAIVSGAVLGLAFLTKLTIVLPVLAALATAEWLALRRRESPNPRAILRLIARGMTAGALIAGPWLLRNVSVYGLLDPLALGRHDAVVVGQPRTAEWIATYGLASWLGRLLVFTFDSFWGVFGWLGEFLDRRVYHLMAAATFIAGLGLARRSRRLAGAFSATERTATLLGLVMLVAVVAAFLGYNWRLVQHQGRYLFGALAPIGLYFSLGLGETGTVLAALLRRAAGLRETDECCSERLAGIVPLGFVCFLAALGWFSLYAYIVPHLSAAP